LVDDLLDVSRIRQGRFALRIARLRLKPIVEHAIEAVPLVQQKSQQLAVEFTADPTSMQLANA
jgi:signal transduction histidine kinase